MPVYFYRWPSGDCSFVTGRDKIHAARALDEYGDPDPPRLMRVSGFMLHLRLDDNGKFALIGFGEVTEDFVFEHGYPLLNKLRFEEEYDCLLYTSRCV